MYQIIKVNLQVLQVGKYIIIYLFLVKNDQL